MGYLRNSNDPILTFEGDNNVLIQQTSNHLLTSYDEFLKTKQIPNTPLKTMDFLTRIDSIKQLKFNIDSKEQLLNVSSILSFYLDSISKKKMSKL